MGIYNPPLATLRVVKDAVMFMTQFPGAYITCMGNFNMWLDPVKKKHGITQQKDKRWGV